MWDSSCVPASGFLNMWGGTCWTRTEPFESRAALTQWCYTTRCKEGLATLPRTARLSLDAQSNPEGQQVIQNQLDRLQTAIDPDFICGANDVFQQRDCLRSDLQLVHNDVNNLMSLNAMETEVLCGRQHLLQHPWRLTRGHCWGGNSAKWSRSSHSFSFKLNSETDCDDPESQEDARSSRSFSYRETLPTQRQNWGSYFTWKCRASSSGLKKKSQLPLETPAS